MKHCRMLETRKTIFSRGKGLLLSLLFFLSVYSIADAQESRMNSGLFKKVILRSKWALFWLKKYLTNNLKHLLSFFWQQIHLCRLTHQFGRLNLKPAASLLIFFFFFFLFNTFKNYCLRWQLTPQLGRLKVTTASSLRPQLKVFHCVPPFASQGPWESCQTNSQIAFYSTIQYLASWMKHFHTGPWESCQTVRFLFILRYNCFMSGWHGLKSRHR